MRNLTFLLLMILPFSVWSQTEMSPYYSVDRVDYQWDVIESDHFLVYFDASSETEARKVLSIANESLQNIEERVGYRLSGKIEILYFRSVYDLNQSYLDKKEIPEDINTGGITQILGNSFPIHRSSDQKDLGIQIKRGIAGILVNEMLYGGTIQERIKYATLLHLPVWFTDGLSEYLAAGWDEYADDRLRIGFEMDIYRNLNNLDYDDEVLAGRSVWKFIDDRRGDLTIPRILYLVRLTRKVESAIYFVFNWSTRDLLEEWESFYRGIYTSDSRRRLPSGEANIGPMLLHGKLSSFKLSPEGDKLAFVQYYDGKYTVVVHDRNYTNAQEEKGISRLWDKRGPGDQIWLQSSKMGRYHLYDPNFYVVEWRDNESLYLVSRNEKGQELSVLDAVGKDDERAISTIENISWVAYDGKNRMLFIASGDVGEHVFLYDLQENAVSPLLSDSNDYKQPTFDAAGIGFYFTRMNFIHNDSVEHEWNSDVGYYRFADQTTDWIANDPDIDEFNPMHYGKRAICYLSDENGIINSYLFDGENVVGLTDYKHNILFQSISRDALYVSEVLRFNGSYHLFVSEQVRDISELSTLLYAAPTYFSARKNYVSPVEEPDSVDWPGNGIDGRNEVSFQTDFPNDDIDSILAVHARARKDKKELQARKYTLRLEPVKVITQVHNGMMNTDRFAAYRTPESSFDNRIGAHFGTEIRDIHKVHSFRGGVKVNSNFYRVEMYAGYINRKHRLVKSFDVWRNSLITTTNNYLFYRNLSNDYSTTWSYPLKTGVIIRANAGFREDSRIKLSSETESLKSGNLQQRFGRIGGELRIDKRRFISDNMYKGLILMANAEVQFGVGGSPGFGVNKIDVRYGYQIAPLLFWMNKVEARNSYGSGKISYFMGGMENWFRPNVASTPYISSQNNTYFVPVFGVRGFSYNARNGNTMAYWNSELRYDLGGRLFKRRGNSEVLTSLMCVGFFDIGSAWYGSSPYDRINPINTRTIETGGLNIVVVNPKNPYIFGVGGGLRTSVFSYYIKADVAWGRDNGKWLDRANYFTIGKDF